MRLKQRTSLVIILAMLFCLLAGVWLIIQDNLGRQALSADLKEQPSPPQTSASKQEQPPLARDKPHNILTAPFEERPIKRPRVSLTLQVQDQTGHPAPGAVIKLLRAYAKTSARKDQLPSFTSFSVTTDARGLALITKLPRGSFRIVARTPDALGRLDVFPGDLALPAKRTVILKPARLAEVLVRDREGQPVPNAFVTFDLGHLDGGLSAWTQDPGGIAQFQVTPLQRWLFQTNRFHPVVLLGTGRFENKPLPWKKPGLIRTTITVERGVTLTVKVAAKNGLPQKDSYTLEWSQFSGHKKKRVGDVALLGGYTEAQGNHRHFKGAQTSVAGFKPGTTIGLVLLQEGRNPVRKTIALPPESGSFDVTFRRGAKAPHILISVVDHGGHPVATKRFLVMVEYGQKARRPPGKRTIAHVAGFDNSLKNSAATDEKGLLAIPVEARQEGRLSVLLWWERPPGSVSVDDEKPLLEGLFPSLEPGATFPMPELQLPAKPLVLEGRVVDEKGAGVPLAQVKLVPDPRGRHSNVYLLRDQDRATVSGLDGHFRLQSSVLPESCVVYAKTGQKAVSDLRPFKLGETGFLLTLHFTGGLQCSFAKPLPGPAPGIALQPRSKPAMSLGEHPHPFMRLWHWAQKDGRVVFAGLLPGTYDASVKLEQFVILRVAGVRIQPGVVSHDPRLQNLVLKDGIQEGEIVVHSQAGTPIRRALVSLFKDHKDKDATLSWGARARTDSLGRARCPFPRDFQPDVLVTAKGYVPVGILQARFPLVVTLKRGCHLALVLDNAEALATEKADQQYLVKLNYEGRGPWGKPRALSPFRSLDIKSGQVSYSGLPPGTCHPVIVRLKMAAVSGSGFSSYTSQEMGSPIQLGFVIIPKDRVDKTVHLKLTSRQIASLKW